MSATKNLAWDQATEFLSKVESKLLEGEMTKEVALKKLNETNYNIAMEGLDSSDDKEEWIDLVIAERQNEVQKMREDGTI
tara:strand:- start:294 stop:533 length:240 start_codon:yes stop_codon:yes gene_type:complete